MDVKSQISSIELDKSYYRPGKTVQIQVSILSEVGNPSKGSVVLTITNLSYVLIREDREVFLENGPQEIEFSYLPAEEAPRGYGIDVEIVSMDGELLDRATSAFDVLDNWVQNPRYGFLTDYEPGRTDAAQTMDILNRFHINGLQFYDWMYRHEKFLTDQEPYYDLWSPKPHSILTVKALIEAAHQRSIAAMPYTAVYGSSRTFAIEHPDWILYTSNGEPLEFGGDKMMIMDPRPDSPWTAYMLDQFKEVLDNTDFDGIHLDQYGDPKVGYDKEGNSYDVAPALAEFINLTKELTGQYSKEDAVVFNAVTNWPIEAAAPSKEDFVYIELWPPYIWFSDLHQVIVSAQKLGGGKPVVLACYIDPTFENNAILNDAIIFASGGGHIEIGENAGMLSGPYFPEYKIMSTRLHKTLQNYYDFTVRYQDVIGPHTQDATMLQQSKISIQNVSTSPSQMSNKVWPIVRESDGRTAINLINFLGVTQVEWDEQVVSPPTPLLNFKLTLSEVSRTADRVWFSSPDHEAITLQPLQFTQDSGSLTVEVPDLNYWSMILIDWSE